MDQSIRISELDAPRKTSITHKMVSHPTQEIFLAIIISYNSADSKLCGIKIRPIGIRSTQGQSNNSGKIYGERPM